MFLNALQASIHIALIFGSSFATLVFVIFESKGVNKANYVRSNTSCIVLFAMQDIFLAYNLFFILDANRRPDLIRDEGRQISYAVKNVIDMSASATSLQDDSE